MANKEKLGELTRDLVIGTSSNGNYVNIKKDGGAELFLGGTSQGDYLPSNQITKSTVGLSEVDNTSDINKPLSNATSVALGDLETKVDSYSADIDLLNTRVDSNSADINTLNTKVDLNSADINTLDTKVDTNSADIDSLSTLVDTNSADINTLDTKVDLNSADINNLDTRVDTNSADIDLLSTLVDTNSADINTLDTKVDLNSTDINNLDTRVDTNSADIDLLNTRVNSNSADIQTIKSSPVIHKIPIHNRDTVFEDKSDANQTGTIKQTVFNTIDCNTLEVVYSNNYRDNYDKISPNTNSIDIRASVEINGVIHPLYFGGSRSYTLSGGEILKSDILDIFIYADDEIYVYTYFDVGVGGYLPLGFDLAFPGNNYEGTDGLEYGVDKVDTGGVVSTGDSANCWGFIAVNSEPVKSEIASVMLIGDSLMKFGSRWDVNAGDFGIDLINSGYGPTALKNANINWTNLSFSGEKSKNFFNSINAREPFNSTHDFVVGNYGINDITNNRTLEQLKADNIAIWQYYYDNGLKVVWTTLAPYTTSTDNWVTEVNQTVTSYESVRRNYNDWLLNDALAENPELLYAVIDVEKVLGTSNNVWREYPIQHTGVAENTSTTTRIYDNTIPDKYNSGTWNNEAYVYITGGTNFGEPPNKVIGYFKNTKQIRLKTAYPVACDDTTNYYVLRTPTTDGLHPRGGSVNLRSAKIVDTSLFKR